MHPFAQSSQLLSCIAFQAINETVVDCSRGFLPPWPISAASISANLASYSFCNRDWRTCVNTRVQWFWLFRQKWAKQTIGDGCKIEFKDTFITDFFVFFSHFMEFWLQSLKKVVVWGWNILWQKFNLGKKTQNMMLISNPLKNAKIFLQNVINKKVMEKLSFFLLFCSILSKKSKSLQSNVVSRGGNVG